MVAWCEDCDGVICQQCFDQHTKMASLRKHHVEHKEEKCSSINLPSSLLICPKHAGLDLRFLCTSCYELVCSDCLLLGGHKHHQYILASEARPELETMMEEFDGLVQSKESEFSEYLEKASEAEGKALEYSELMKSEVNNVFDGIL